MDFSEQKWIHCHKLKGQDVFDTVHTELELN